MVYIELNRKFLDKNLKKMAKNAEEWFGDEGKEYYVYNDGLQGEVEEIDEDRGIITVSFESKFGTVVGDVKLTTDNLLDIINIASKQLEKLKSVLKAVG